jgi:type III restriction enzyme
LDAPLRICEELYYHCQNDSRYIGELHNALREIGLDLDKAVTRKYMLKSSFKNDSLYKEGFVFFNTPLEIDRADVDGLPQSINRPFDIRLATGQGGEDVILDSTEAKDNGAALHTTSTTIGDIARVNYAYVHKAIRKYSVLRYNALCSRFPNLMSIRDFVLIRDIAGIWRLSSA